MITLPRITKPTSALVFSKGVWVARYREDGKLRCRSMSTIHLHEASARRDALFASLRAQGAVTAARQSNRRTVSPMYGIRRMKPFRVILDKKRIGDYDTLEQAREARDAAMPV